MLQLLGLLATKHEPYIQSSISHSITELLVQSISTHNQSSLGYRLSPTTLFLMPALFEFFISICNTLRESLISTTRLMLWYVNLINITLKFVSLSSIFLLMRSKRGLDCKLLLLFYMSYKLFFIFLIGPLLIFLYSSQLMPSMYPYHTWPAVGCQKIW